MKRPASSRRRPAVHITLGRAARLHRLVMLLADQPRGREGILGELTIGLRTFYRELELLKRCGVKIQHKNKAYTHDDHGLSGGGTRSRFPGSPAELRRDAGAGDLTLPRRGAESASPLCSKASSPSRFPGTQDRAGRGKTGAKERARNNFPVLRWLWNGPVVPFGEKLVEHDLHGLLESSILPAGLVNLVEDTHLDLQSGGRLGLGHVVRDGLQQVEDHSAARPGQMRRTGGVRSDCISSSKAGNARHESRCPGGSPARRSLNKYMVALLLPPPSHNTSIFLASG